MNLSELIKRVRNNVYDEDENLFLDETIIDYINEGIDRVKQVIDVLSDMEYLKEDGDIPKLLPDKYHHLLALYSSSRCFSKDERHHQASNIMNEFEYKLIEFSYDLDNGKDAIVDDWGDPIHSDHDIDYVIDNYFVKNRRDDRDNEVV